MLFNNNNNNKKKNNLWLGNKATQTNATVIIS